MIDLYSILYQFYLKLFRPGYGGKLNTGPSKTPSLDEIATRYGNAYRGSGILVGILGALIIFCAVAPVGFDLIHHPSAIYFGFAEVLLMVWVLATLYQVNKEKLKEKWIQTRREAEIERYAPLKASLNGDLSQLVAAVEPLLGGGKSCQIAYNQTKHDQYEAIEHSAEKTTLIGFVISLVAAILHLVIHTNKLIFLTAFLPAAVGALHGINAFLRLEQLAHDHSDLAGELELLKASFDKAVSDNDLASARSKVEELYELLTQSHHGWQNIAERIKVRAP